MESRELRIGNLVYDLDDNLCETMSLLVDDIGILCNDIDTVEDIKNLKPIPLTEEWLIKFGFDKSDKTSKGDTYMNSSSPIELLLWQNSGKISFRIGNEFILLPHVHRLQNLYFCLTGEELTIK